MLDSVGVMEQALLDLMLTRIVVLIAETVSLGILSLPKADSTMGFFPGVFLNVVIGLLAVCYVFEICKGHTDDCRRIQVL